MSIDMERLALENLGRMKDEYVRQMEHIARYAQEEARSVRGGVFPDQLAAAVMASGIAAYNSCLGADSVLKSIREQRATDDGTPVPGQMIYVETSLYLDRGEDDVCGGLATVMEVYERISAGRPTPFVKVKEHGGTGYNWRLLSAKQGALQRRFGTKPAHRCPEGTRCPSVVPLVPSEP